MKLLDRGQVPTVIAILSGRTLPLRPSPLRTCELTVHATYMQVTTQSHFVMPAIKNCLAGLEDLVRALHFIQDFTWERSVTNAHSRVPRPLSSNFSISITFDIGYERLLLSICSNDTHGSLLSNTSTVFWLVFFSPIAPIGYLKSYLPSWVILCLPCLSHISRWLVVRANTCYSAVLSRMDVSFAFVTSVTSASASVRP